MALKYFDAPIKSFNLEITNRCTLKCSECDRTNNEWVAKNLTDISLETLENAFPESQRELYQGLRVNLCGAHGDCIYHRKFHEVISFLKEKGLRVMIETNGSYKKKEFWEKTCDLLDENDAITFSVDGLSDTNHIYRKNSKWEDIEMGMRYCAQRVKVDWKYIIFSHNEHQVEDAKKLAKDIGVYSISFKKSARFRMVDPLSPKNDDYMGIVARNRQALTQSYEEGKSVIDQNVEIIPKCISGKNLAVTALGYLYPCTSCESKDQSTWFAQNKEHFDLKQKSIEEILKSDKWKELEEMWETPSQAPSACLRSCGVHKDFVQTYKEEQTKQKELRPKDIVSVIV